MVDKQSWVLNTLKTMYAENINNGEVYIETMSNIKKADEWGVCVEGVNQELNMDVLRVASILSNEYNYFQAIVQKYEDKIINMMEMI